MVAQDFIRAHGEEQKAVRVDQIVEATLALYDEVGYDKVTFSRLAQGLGFSRINLYNYFRTKEELFLEIVRRAYEELAADVERSLPDTPCDAGTYIEAWCSVASRHGRTFELFVLMNMQVMRTVGPERAAEFQGYLDDMVTRIARRLTQCLGIADDEAWGLVAHQLNYAMGLYPIILRVYGAYEGASAFYERYQSFLEVLLRGAVARRADGIGSR